MYDDTHRAVKALCEAWAAEALAETFVETVGDAITGNAATKADTAASEVALRADISESETALRTEINKSEAALRAEIAEGRTEVVNVPAEL